MTPVEAMQRFAASATDALILPGGCHYPAQASPAPRSGQVVAQGYERPDVEADGQLWLWRFACFVIGPALTESAYDVASIDPLVIAVADHFDASNPEAYHLEGDGDRVDDCRTPTGAVEQFAGWYAYRMDWVVKLQR